jgi:hypothetical protein
MANQSHWVRDVTFDEDRSQVRCGNIPHVMAALRNTVIGRMRGQHLGSEAESNLCLCCLRCNLKEGPNIASTDPEAGRAYRIVALFHPRKQRWHEHFHLRDDGRIVGLPPEGRATARLFDFNAEERVQLRRRLMRQGWRP